MFPEQKAFKKEVTEYTPSQLNEISSKLFLKFDERGENVLTKRITEKFAKENPDEDAMTVILPRAKRFVKHYALIPLNTKLVLPKIELGLSAFKFFLNSPSKPIE